MTTGTNPDSPSPDDILALALDVAAKVTPRLLDAQQQRRDSGTAISVEAKLNTSDLVTELDSWSEETIVAELLGARPNDSILGEEGSSVEGSSGVRWIIDPIDGTTNYFYDLAGYSVSIAAQIDQTTVAAVVADPVRGDVFAATLGGGATLNGSPIIASSKADLATALVGTGFNPRPETRLRQVAALQTILPAVRDIRRIGGAALDIAMVACGRLDAHYEEGLSIWDVAAGWLILTEAGGRVTDLNGRPDTPGTSVCSAAGVHDDLVRLVESSNGLAAP